MYVIEVNIHFSVTILVGGHRFMSCQSSTCTALTHSNSELQPTCGHPTGSLIAQLVSIEKLKCRELGVLDLGKHFTNDSPGSL